MQKSGIKLINGVPANLYTECYSSGHAEYWYSNLSIFPKEGNISRYFSQVDLHSNPDEESIYVFLAEGVNKNSLSDNLIITIKEVSAFKKEVSWDSSKNCYRFSTKNYTFHNIFGGDKTSPGISPWNDDPEYTVAIKV